MNFSRIKTGLLNRTFSFINERRGWFSDRKIIVIESDDWGSIRMPNKEVYDEMLNSSLRVDNCNYCNYDSLASNDDFQHLYEILSKHKDFNGRSPVITANTIMANPNFEKIRDSDFKEYHYESFLKTIERYPNHSFKSWQEGIDRNLFFPQFHGREHLNVTRWMVALQNNSKEVHHAFRNNFFGISKTISNENNPSFMAALDIDELKAQQVINKSIEEGLGMFEKIFGYPSESFIAPNYIWNSEVENVLANNGVRILQGGVIQKVPLSKDKYNYTGKINKNKQIYLKRNVIFEPSKGTDKNWIADSLKQIDTAFKLHKPSIICSHRVNFIGNIHEKNRTDNLKMLDSLLSESLKKWPDIEFMTSAELGNLIRNDIS